MATLLSLLAAAIRKGQQQCCLPPGIRNQDLESFRVAFRQLHSYFPVPATPRAQASHPNYHSRRQEAGWMWGRRVLVQLLLFMILAAITLPLNQLKQLQWQKGVHKHRHGPAQVVSQQQPQQQLCTHSILHIPKAQPTPTGSISVARHRTFLCLISSCSHA